MTRVDVFFIAAIALAGLEVVLQVLHIAVICGWVK